MSRFAWRCQGSDHADIYIEGPIDEPSYWDEDTRQVSASEVIAKIRELKDSPRDIVLHINSTGGSLFDGVDMGQALKEYREETGRTVTAKVQRAFSAATPIACAASPGRLFLSETGAWLVHAPMFNTCEQANAKRLRELAGELDTVASALVAIYRERVSDEEIDRTVFSYDDHLMSPGEARERGWVDHIFKQSVPLQNRKVLNMKETQQTDAVTAERSRIAGILALAESHKAPLQMAQDAIEGGISTTDFELAAMRNEVKALQRAAEELRDAPAPARAKNEVKAIAAPGADGRVELSLRNRKLKYFANERDAYAAGCFGRAVIGGDIKASRWLYENTGMDVRNQSLSTFGSAGVLVPTELESAIIDIRETHGVARQNLRIRSMSSDTLTVPKKLGGPSAVPLGEAGTATAQNLEGVWTNVNLIARKWGALVKMPSELAEDAVIDLGMDLAEDIAEAVYTAEDGAAFAGDGTSTYHGIVGLQQKSLLAAHAGGKVTASGDLFTEVTLTDIALLMASIRANSRRNAAFFCSRVGFALTLLRLKLAAGGNSARDLEAAAPDSFLGYPVYFVEDFPSVTTTLEGVAMLAFGDARRAGELGTRRGIRILQSSERYLEEDQLAFMATTRFDINWVDIGTATANGAMAVLVGGAA